MFRKALGTVIALVISSYAFAMNGNVGFESSEHVSAGNDVNLKGLDNSSLLLPNGVALTYGQLVSLADFYEIVGKPISQAADETDRKERFLASFQSLAQNPKVQAELSKILDAIAAEKKAVDDGMGKGEKPEDIYKRISNDTNRKFNCATGGDCSAVWWIRPGRYLQLAAQDVDHFGENAWRTYQIGHDAALEIAYAAHQTHDKQQLQLAYAMNGFASHFLSDRFSAGHIRIPRKELPAKVTPPVLGSLLSDYMHGEDSEYGLHVRNYRGDEWIAYGDRYYFDNQNSTNRELLREALQLSADQIYQAYQQGSAFTPLKKEIYELFPQPDEFGNDAQLDPASLFYWDADANKLMRRKDVNNINDRNWTADWWGWTTLILLSRAHGGLPLQYQGMLAMSDLRNQALQDGLITDKTVLRMISKK